jgi:multidrug efflux pump subunit AcrA (membrane-fusion protein)
MSTDMLPKNNPNTSPGEWQDSSSGGWWKRGLLTVVVISVLASAVVLIPGAISTKEPETRLTHTIQRGDLLVSVIEQGTLESFHNTEIKCKVRGSSTVTWVIGSGTVVEPGDELVRLDTKRIEEEVSLGRTNVFEATATMEETKADLAAARIAIDAYLDGRFRSRLKSLETGLAIAKSNLQSAEKMLAHSKLLFKRGYVTELELEGNTFTVTQAELELKVAETRVDVLQRFTKEMELESMNGRVTYTTIKLKADEAGLAMDEKRRDRAIEELESCVIRAEKAGMVIYPTAEAWKNQPDITEGARVTKDQVLLIMPELSKMQVKVGIHESIIDRVKKGMVARIRLPEIELFARVSSVAAITKPAGWWTGNVVKYDTIVELPDVGGLKPGMTAEVEVIIARHVNVLKIPVAAVVQTEDGDFCWVQTAEETMKIPLTLGDSNDVFIEVKQGLKEGDKVILNPIAMIKEAENEAGTTVDSTKAEPSSKSTDSEPSDNSQ